VFYDGRRPARRPLPVLVGSADCIEHGDKEGLAVINDVSAACSPILPGPCYAPLSETHALTDVQDCVFAKTSADIITLAYTDLATAEAAAAAYLGDDAVVTSFEQPHALIPAGVIAIKEDTCVLWLTGTTTQEQLATQALYFGFGPISFGPYSAGALYQAAALVIADQLTAAGVAACPRVILVGHSYGGAVVDVLTAIMLLADEDRDVHLLTLAAPQPGDERLFQLIRFVDQRHYANERDPIPYLPPRGLTFHELVPIIGPALGLLWRQFHRPPNTTMILQDGAFVEFEEANFPNDLIHVAARVIAEARAMPSFVNHKTEWYAYYLCLACACVPKPCVPPDPVQMTFLFELDNLELIHLGDTVVFNVPPTVIPVTGSLPDGTPFFWAGATPGDFFVEIGAFFYPDDDYESFQVVFFFERLGDARSLTWTFDAPLMLAGVETSELPEYNGPNVGDEVVSLSSLNIKPDILA